MTKKSLLRASVLPVIALTLMGAAVGGALAHADTSNPNNYKQAFSASNATMSGIFDVAGDESGVTYTLAGISSGSLECQSSAGTWIDVADISSSGTVTGANISAAAADCSTNITTIAHLIQNMREGKIALVSGGTQLWLASSAISDVPPSVTSTTGGDGTTASSTPSTGTGTTASTTTATSTDMGTGMGTGTSTPPVITVGTTTDTVLGTTTLSASDLRVALDEILRGHVSTSIDVLRVISNMPAGATSSPELTAALAEQDQNAVDLSNAIGSVYGPAAGTQFLTLFRAHIVDSNAYTMALKNGNAVNEQAALADLDVQLQGIASFLATANPNLDDAALLSGLRTHEQLVNQSSTDYTQGDYADAYAVEQQALTQISGAATYIASGIVAQYPGSFTQ